MTSSPKILSIEQAARVLGVSHWTIRGWLKRGILTRVRVGRLSRVYEAELFAMMKPERKVGDSNGR
jgi:excisionase family DNA binding protein